MTLSLLGELKIICDPKRCALFAPVRCLLLILLTSSERDEMRAKANGALPMGWVGMWTSGR